MITPEQAEVLKKLAIRTRRWALKHGGGLSQNMCGDSSAVFCRRFHSHKKQNKLFHGLVCQFAEGFFETDNGTEGHCWIEINRELLIDVTADQFNHKTSPKFPPIVFDHVKKVGGRYRSCEYISGLNKRIEFGIFKKKTSSKRYCC